MARNPYTRKLHPERINDDDGKWLYFECSDCRKLIEADPNDSDLLEKVFVEHLKADHPAGKPREDFSQAAARIVREATERD